MKLARVIGRVVLSHAEFPNGGKLCLVSPLGRAEMQDAATPRISEAASFVVYDQLGAREGDLIGVTEGGEAMRPFDKPMPIDAYNSCIIDELHFQPLP